MKTQIPKSIKPMGAIDTSPIEDLLKSGMERYNKIRDGVMFCFKEYNIKPVVIYRMSCELDWVAMVEYHDALIKYSVQLIKGEIIDKSIEYDKWTNIFDLMEKDVRTCWQKIVGIFKAEKVKVMELSRIAAELRTSAMENFISALGLFIEDKQKEFSKEKSEEKKK